ncbi:MAG: hypothetical protein GX596_05160, partial [Propionibacterium sp.]|nr:hypothetical protein [Propionibacterium sp.]
SLAGQIGDQVVEYRQHHIDQIEAVVETLNSAVTDILKTEEQRNAINRLSEPSGQGSVGWPDPAQLSARKAEGSTSFGDLKFQVQYFKDHITFWSDLSEDFSGPVGTAESTPPIDTMFHEFPGFMATTASGLNSLAGHIKDKALQRGQNATAKMSEILDLTIRTYLEGEEINTQQALELEKMLDE